MDVLFLNIKEDVHNDNVQGQGGRAARLSKLINNNDNNIELGLAK